MTVHMFCPFCELPMAEMLTDKRGRPYAKCLSCAIMLFMQTARAADGWRRLSARAEVEAGPKLIDQWKQRMDLIEAERKMPRSIASGASQVPVEIKKEVSRDPR